MMKRLLWVQLLSFFSAISVTLHAQNTITTQAISISSICPGLPIYVPFTVQGTYAATNVFTVQLSNGGDYVNLATVGSVNLDGKSGIYTIPVSIPASTAAGTTYSIRVTSSSPAVIGTPSPTRLTIKAKPVTPTVEAIQLDCQRRIANDPFSYINFKKLATSTARIYDQNQNLVQEGASVNSDPTSAYFALTKPVYAVDNGYVYPVSETPYYLSQVVDGCESDKASTTLRILYRPSMGPVPVNRTSALAGILNYCQGDKTYPLNVNGHSAPPTNYQVSYYFNNSTTTTPPTPDSSVPSSTQYLMSLVPIDGNKGCASPTQASTYLFVNVNARPAKPTVQTSTVSLCQFQSAPSLTATTNATGATLVWYGTDASGGTGSTTASQPSTNNTGTFKYYVAQKLNDCESERAEITVEVKAASPAPTTQNLSYCVGYAAPILSATATSGGTLKWYASASSMTPLSTAPSPPTNVANTLYYYVTQTVGSACESQRIQITVTVTGPPAAPSAPKPTYTFCQYSTGETLQAIGQNLQWYDSQTSTTNLGSVTPSTATPGTKQYFVSQTINTCESPRTAVTVTILDAPAAPTVAQTSYTFCQGIPNAVITGTINPSSSYSTSWYIYGDEPGLLSNYTVGSTAYAMISTAQARNLTYSVFQTGSNGCKGPASSLINITIKPSPSSPIVQSVAVCQGAPAPILPSELVYYTSSSGGTGSTTTPIISTSQAFQTTYFVSQSLNGCESQRSALSVTVSPIPGVPTVASTGPIYCQSDKALPLSATAQGTLNWYKESSGGTSLGSSFTPDTKDPGSVTYYVSQKVNGCEGGRSSITVKVNATPAPPTLGDGRTSLCQFDAKPTIIINSKTGYIVLVARQASGGTLKDTLVQLTATNDTVRIPLSLLSTSDAQTLTYRINNRDGNGCSSTQLSVNVAVNATPVAPSVQALSACQNEVAPTLSASGSNPRWYNDQSGGTGSATPPPVSTAQPGTTNYFVSQTVGVCEGPRATLAVTVKPQPSAPSVTSPVNVCQNSKASLLAATAENPAWYSPEGLALGSNAPAPITDQVKTLNYTVSQTINGCTSPKATVTVNVVTTPPPTVSQSIVELCQNGASQALQATGSGQLQWTDPNGVVSTTAPTPPTINATTKPDGDIYYVSLIGNNSCESVKVAIKVFVQTVPTLSITGTTTTNLGLDVPLKLSFTGVGPYRYKLSTGLTGTAIKDTTILILAEKTTVFQVAEVSNKCGNGLPGNGASATVTVRIPTIRTLAFTSTSLCAGSGFTTNFATTGDFNPGSVFKAQIAKVETDTSKAVFIDMPGTLFGTGQFAGSIPTSIASGTYWVRVMATNPRIPVVGSISPTILTVKSLASATLAGAQTIYEGQLAKLTVSFTGDGPWSFTYKDSTASAVPVVRSSQATTNPYSFSVNPTKTTAYYLTNVGNACGDNARVGASVVVVVSPLLAVEDVSLLNALQMYPVPATATLTVRIIGLSTAQPAQLELLDANGKTIHQQEARREISVVNVDQQPSGVYLLRVRVGDRTATKRIVKL